MRLNLGCQIHYFEGFVNIDIVGDDPNVKVDLACDVIKLPYEDNTVDFIYAGHLIEHFYPNTLPVAIREWHRVLKRGGRLAVLTPDCGRVFKEYASGKLRIEETWQPVYGRIFDYDTPSERHHIAFDQDNLMQVMHGAEYRTREQIDKGDIPNAIEWASAEEFDLKRPPQELEPFMDKHISRGAYQIGAVLTK